MLHVRLPLTQLFAAPTFRSMPNDPAALFRDLLGQWETAANQFGQNMLKSGEAARTMGAATTVAAKGQEATREAMGKALTAFNLPSRVEMVAMAEQVARIDERLSRIESLLIKLAGESAQTAPARPRPARTRRPPEAPAGTKA